MIPCNIDVFTCQQLCDSIYAVFSGLECFIINNATIYMIQNLLGNFTVHFTAEKHTQFRKTANYINMLLRENWMPLNHR